MHVTAELIGATAGLVGLWNRLFLSVRGFHRH